MITLFSTGCRQCNILKSQLDKNEIEYQTVSDIKEMEGRGILSAPVLDVDGDLLDYGKAIAWISQIRQAK